MKINKLFWIFGLVFVLSSTAAFAFFHGSLTGFFRNQWVVFIVNTLLIWSVLFIASLFLVTSQETRVKVVVWIVTLGLAVLIAYNILSPAPAGSAYLWEAGWIAQYLKLTLLVNTIILAIAIFYIAGFLGVAPPTFQGQIGLALGALLLAGMIAYSLPAGTWIWNENNIQNLWKYLRGPNGILTIDKVNIFESRLFIFITATILFAWFFAGFIPTLGQGSPRLTYVMAFIIGAQLASKGTTTGTMIGIGESFALLMIGSQVAASFGGRWWGWIIGVTLVEWIFCAVFEQSRALKVLGEVGYVILSSGFVSTLITLWIISLALRSPNWVVGAVIALFGGIVGIVNYTGALGSGFRAMLNYDICKLLAQHTATAPASTASGGIINNAFADWGMNVPYGGPWLDYIGGIGAIIGTILIYRFRNVLGLNLIRRLFGRGP